MSKIDDDWKADSDALKRWREVASPEQRKVLDAIEKLLEEGYRADAWYGAATVDHCLRVIREALGVTRQDVAALRDLLEWRDYHGDPPFDDADISSLADHIEALWPPAEGK